MHLDMFIVTTNTTFKHPRLAEQVFGGTYQFVIWINLKQLNRNESISKLPLIEHFKLFQRNLAKITRLIKQTFPRSDATKHSLNVVKRSSPVALSIEGDEGLLRLNCQTYLVFELKELSIDTVLMQFSVSVTFMQQKVNNISRI